MDLTRFERYLEDGCAIFGYLYAHGHDRKLRRSLLQRRKASVSQTHDMVSQLLVCIQLKVQGSTTKLKVTWGTMKHLGHIKAEANVHQACWTHNANSGQTDGTKASAGWRSLL